MQCNSVGKVWSKGVDITRQKNFVMAGKLWFLAVIVAAFSAAACSSGGGPSMAPPPQAAPEWFFVDNFSGDVSGFSASTGQLAPIPGSSSVVFPLALTEFAVEPDARFLAVISETPQLVSTLRFANIAPGGALSIVPVETTVTSPGGLAISSKGLIAVTDTNDATVQLFVFQNNLLFTGPAVATGGLPQDAIFSADGSKLYVGNDGDGTVSVFSVSNTNTLQLVQTATLAAPPAFPSAPVVRLRLSPSGGKFAATTLDGWLFMADVSAPDGTLSGFTETMVATNANLEEVVFDPNGQNVYTADQDNGGIYGFSLKGSSVTPLAGSPFSTGTLPGGPTGMAFNSAGDRLYVVMGAQSAVFTYSSDTSGGRLSATGDVVSSGGQLAARIARVPAH